MTFLKRLTSFTAPAMTAAALLAATVPAAQAAEGVILGERVVSDRGEVDMISGRGDGAVRAIRLCVRRRAVEMFDIDVVFRNAGRQDVDVRRVIRAGECTRRIDLRGGDRFIKRVKLKYRSARAAGPQPVVVLFGYR